MNTNTIKKDGMVTITITGKDSKVIKDLELLIMKAVVLAEGAEQKDDVPEYEVTSINKVRTQGRPRVSCFGPNSQEYRADKLMKVSSFLAQYYSTEKEVIEFDGLVYGKEVFGALLSYLMIPYYNNQTDFAHFLREAGMRVEYRSYMKSLARFHRKLPKRYIKIGKYLIEFLELVAPKNMD